MSDLILILDQNKQHQTEKQLKSLKTNKTRAWETNKKMNKTKNLKNNLFKK